MGSRTAEIHTLCAIAEGEWAKEECVGPLIIQTEGRFMMLQRTLGSVAWFIIVAATWNCGALEAQNRIVSPDGTVSVLLPDGFGEAQLNPAADLQFADTLTGSFFMLLTEPKDDLFGWNLTRHSMITLASILTATDFPELTGPTSLELGGYPAVQYELRGVSQGTQIVFLHTTIDAPTRFAQFLVWSPRSKWNANEWTLRDVLESIEVEDADPSVSDPLLDVFGVVPGTWAWEGSETGCASDTQTFVISDDHSQMTIFHSEPYEKSDGTMISTTEYVVEGATELVLHTFIPGEIRLTDEGAPVKWDLVAINRDRMAWHRADWDEGEATKALVRCTGGL